MTPMWGIFRSAFTVLVRLHERLGFLVGFFLMQWTKASLRVWRAVVRQFWPVWSHVWAASEPRRALDWR